MDSLTDLYGVYTYKEPLIFNKIDNYQNKYHRALAFRRDPLLRTYVTKLDEEVFSELPIFDPDILNRKKEESPGGLENNIEVPEEPSEGSSGTKQDWLYERWSAFLIKTFDMARVHRWCIATMYNDYPWWGVYGPMEVREITYDDNGKALEAKIIAFKHLPYSRTVLLKFNETIKFGDDQPSLFIHYGKPEGRYMNSDDIEHVWDLAVQLRYIRNDIVRNSAKSSGFYFMKLGKGASPQHKNKVEESMQKANYGNMLAASGNLIEEIRDIHPENAEFSIMAYNKILKTFAGACRLPLIFFNSETEEGGIGTENKQDSDILINKKKKFIFGQFKTVILKLVEKRWGVLCDNVFPNLEEYEDETYKEDVIENKKNNKEEES